MNDNYVQLLLLLRSLWLRRWYALGVAWLVTLGGWMYVTSIPDKYESSAQIYIDTDTMLKDLLEGVTVAVDVNRQVQVMQQTLLSRPNMERVLRMSDLDLGATSDAQVAAMANQIRSKVQLTPVAPNLFRLSYEDHDRQKAQRVVQSLLTIFVESNLGLSRQDISQARRFLDEQIRDYEQQLSEAEQRRATFRRDNIGMLPGDDNYYARMQREKSELVDRRRQYNDAVLTRTELGKQAVNVPKFIAIRTAGGTNKDSFTSGDQVAEMRRKLAELDAMGYTPVHPDVIAAQESLDKAIETFNQEKATAAASNDGGEESPLNPNATMVNPVWEQIQVKLVETDTAIASLRARMAEQEQMIAQLDELAKTVPNVEAELLRLDRDYDIVKKKYEDLLQRRESARITQDLEGKTDKVQFRVIEPPDLPRGPSSPNRAALLSASLLVGLGAGLGVAFLLSQVHHTFSTANRLRASFDLPVLGTISAVSFDSYSRRKRVEIASFSVVLVGLIVAYVFVMTYRIGPVALWGTG
ncbi:XrtA system polysaccharide chain length determinant [Iodidimonas sp. SYSU 1G8]|uniref:XrtA system polysaccharide chain length determinant n=1 Tax=Iodidimonas sp. SYSU 1G8 TaxID=3133967 RepID=UPI0031FED591